MKFCRNRTDLLLVRDQFFRGHPTDSDAFHKGKQTAYIFVGASGKRKLLNKFSIFSRENIRRPYVRIPFHCPNPRKFAFEFRQIMITGAVDTENVFLAGHFTFETIGKILRIFQMIYFRIFRQIIMQKQL